MPSSTSAEASSKKRSQKREKHGSRREKDDSGKKKSRPSKNANSNGGPETSSSKTVFEQGGDFIAFDFTDEENNKEHGREWDHGKLNSRSKDDGKYDLVFDEDDLHSRHNPGSNNRTPWLKNVNFDNCDNVAELLHREVESFLSWISPTSAEEEIRTLIVQMISRAITSAFPDAKIRAFGSYETKLYLPQGDIDLVILSDSMARYDKNSVLHGIARAIQQAGITNKVTIIAKARVPIVKFITLHGRLKVDISINQTNGLVSGSLVNGFLVEMKSKLALRMLIMATKAFLLQRNLNEVYTGGLGSYAVVCLAVSFLQMHPKIRKGHLDPDKNLGVLLMEFFELYGCYFNYENVGISVRNGGTYFNKRSRGWYDDRKRNALSIEDPGDISNDISSGSFAFQSVQQTFAGAHGMLTSTAYLRASILQSRRDGTALCLRDSYYPEDLSVLSSIVNITQETLNHRRLIQEVYDKGTLHAILNIMHKPLRDPLNTSGKDSSTTNSWRVLQDLSEDETTMDVISDDPEEEGRYAIGRKRRKLSPAFTGEDSSEEEDEKKVKSWNKEEGEIRIRPTITHKPRSASSISSDKRKEFWTKKGEPLEA